MRLNRYLALCGLASRRGAEELITAGRVTVNGKPVTDLATTVEEGRDRVRVDGVPVYPPRQKVYVLLNKPKGVITTAKDEKGRRSVLDLVKLKERVFPVGRLDRNSEGLLLLTNDGELAHRLMHPRFKVQKTYRVQLEQPFDPNDFIALTQGVELEDGRTQPCSARYYGPSPSQIEIRIREGRYHQVRRMFEQLGYSVRSLKRVQYGPLVLEDLPRGRWRMLKQQEVDALFKAVGLHRKGKPNDA
ncbi:MAG: rRNA pseudouridine synthase [candidate division KSB1 bacterium]|nr:rRNA pseudouridine synthase [candidate division KSB1 bacterium]